MASQIKWGMKQILALGRVGNTEAGAVSARAGEGAAARTDPLVHLPEKFTVLRLLFLDAFSQNWASAAPIPALWLAVSEPIVMPVQLKMGFPRTFLQPHLPS